MCNQYDELYMINADLQRRIQELESQVETVKAERDVAQNERDELKLKEQHTASELDSHQKFAISELERRHKFAISELEASHKVEVSKLTVTIKHLEQENSRYKQDLQTYAAGLQRLCSQVRPLQVKYGDFSLVIPSQTFCRYQSNLPSSVSQSSLGDLKEESAAIVQSGSDCCHSGGQDHIANVSVLTSSHSSRLIPSTFTAIQSSSYQSLTDLEKPSTEHLKFENQQNPEKQFPSDVAEHQQTSQTPAQSAILSQAVMDTSQQNKSWFTNFFKSMKERISPRHSKSRTPPSNPTEESTETTAVQQTQPRSTQKTKAARPTKTKHPSMLATYPPISIIRPDGEHERTWSTSLPQQSSVAILEHME